MRAIIEMRRDNPTACGFMPYVVNGVMQFCRDHDTESDPVEQGENLWRRFAAGDRQIGLWAVVEDGHVIGHLFATPEPMDQPGRYQYVLIRQATNLPGKNARSENEAIWQRCVQWSKTLGVSRIMALTPKSSRAVHRRWGFREYKRLLVYDIDMGDDNGIRRERAESGQRAGSVLPVPPSVIVS